MSTSLLTRDGLPSVAARQLADEARAVEGAAVTWADAQEWGKRNKLRPCGDIAKDLAAINRLRKMMQLPPFVITAQRGPAVPLPPVNAVAEEDRSLPPPTVVRAAAPALAIPSASKQLRDVLFQEISDLRSGTSTPQRAQAVAKLAQQLIATVRIEMDWRREATQTIDGSVEEAG